MGVYIKLTDIGADVSQYVDLYSDVDSYVTPFAEDIDINDLYEGYWFSGAPFGTTIVRIVNGDPCNNYVDITLLYNLTFAGRGDTAAESCLDETGIWSSTSTIDIGTVLYTDFDVLYDGLKIYDGLNELVWDVSGGTVTQVSVTQCV